MMVSLSLRRILFRRMRQTKRKRKMLPDKDSAQGQQQQQQQQQQEWQDSDWVNSPLGLDPALLGQRQSITEGQGQGQGQPGNFYPYLNNSYGPTYPRAQETFIQHPQSSSPAFVRQQQQERPSRSLISPAFQLSMNANQPKPMPIVVSGSPRLPQHSQPPQMAANLANPLARAPSSSSRPPQHSPRPRMTMKQANPPIHAPSNPQRRPTQYPQHSQMATMQTDSPYPLQYLAQRPRPQAITNQPKPPVQGVSGSSTQQLQRSPHTAHMNPLEYHTQTGAAPQQQPSHLKTATGQPKPLPRAIPTPTTQSRQPQQPPHSSRPSAPPNPTPPPKPQPSARLDTANGTKRRRLEDEQNTQPYRQTIDITESALFPAQDLSEFSYKPRDVTSKNFLRDRGGLVQPLNDADAAKKTSYDPKTIARDVLVAAGRHPTEPALNHHLRRLRDVFTQVDTSSDLNTFRWDIVDAPGMQALPKSVQTVEQSDSPPAMNGHPSSHQSNLQLAQPDQPSQLQRPTNQELSTVDLTRDSPQPMESTPARTPPSRPAFSVRASPQQQQQQSRPPQPSQQIQQSQSRPEASAATPKPGASQPMIEIQLPQTPHSSRLQTEKTSGEQRDRSAESARKPSQPKPRGRLPKDRQEKPQTEKMVGKRSASRVQVSVPRSAPVSYPVYACKWQNCPSELHNLDLLRHHLLKSHIPYTITCGWSGCTCPDKMAAAELFGHIKTHHLEPIAWKLGDGPSVPRTGDNDEASKSSRAQATPESNQLEGEDSLVFPASYSSIRAFNRVHGNNSQQDKGREILKAVQRLKERIGVGLDPGGCQLATPERTERISDEEEVYDLHSESESGLPGTPEPELKS